MRYRYLGRSGIQISELSYGAWVTFANQLDVEQAFACMRVAFDAGCNFFDNAEVYADGRAETVMGEAFKKLGWRRDEYLVSTKVFWGGKGVNQRGLSRKHIVEGTEAALRRLQLDYVDLLFCHRADLHTPIEETVRAMNHVIDQGKALYWGTSEWSAQQITEACGIAERLGLVPPLVEQPQYNMLHRERVEVEFAPLYPRYGLGTTIWSPLASGMLTGKYKGGVPPGSRLEQADLAWLRRRFESDEGRRKIALVEGLRPIAAELGCTLAQLAIAWCAKNPNVSTVLTGASRVEQVAENMLAVAVVPKLDAAVISAIEAVLRNKPEPPQDWR